MKYFSIDELFYNFAVLNKDNKINSKKEFICTRY